MLQVFIFMPINDDDDDDLAISLLTSNSGSMNYIHRESANETLNSFP